MLVCRFPTVRKTVGSVGWKKILFYFHVHFKLTGQSNQRKTTFTKLTQQNNNCKTTFKKFTRQINERKLLLRSSRGKVMNVELLLRASRGKVMNVKLLLRSSCGKLTNVLLRCYLTFIWCYKSFTLHVFFFTLSKSNMVSILQPKKLCCE